VIATNFVVRVPEPTTERWLKPYFWQALRRLRDGGTESVLFWEGDGERKEAHVADGGLNASYDLSRSRYRMQIDIVLIGAFIAILDWVKYS
jgi:hypothetical protein